VQIQRYEIMYRTYPLHSNAGIRLMFEPKGFGLHIQVLRVRFQLAKDKKYQNLILAQFGKEGFWKIDL